METADNLTIPVQPRTGLKKRDTKQLRKGGGVPAVVYGPGGENRTVSLDIRLAEKFSKRIYKNKIFTFQSDEKSLNGLKVLKKDMTVHPLTRRPLHLDFLSLDMTRPVRVSVEIRFEGKPKGVREESGVFSATLRWVEVECLPADIPPFLTIDVTSLTLNQNLHVSDLKTPEKIKLMTKKERTLCTVSETKEESPEATEETAAAKEAPSAPGEGKKQGGTPPATAKKDS